MRSSASRFSHAIASGVPSEIVAKISRDLAKVMNDKGLQERLEKAGLAVDNMPRDEWIALMQAVIGWANKLLGGALAQMAQAAGIPVDKLLPMLAQQLPGVPMEKTDNHGVPAHMRKAVASAGLAALIMDNVPARVAYIDREFRFRFINRHKEEWLSERREELTGRRIDKLLASRKAPPKPVPPTAG